MTPLKKNKSQQPCKSKKIGDREQQCRRPEREQAVKTEHARKNGGCLGSNVQTEATCFGTPWVADWHPFLGQAMCRVV